MEEIKETLVATQSKANIDDRRRFDRSVRLPSVGNVISPCKSFIQRSDHAIQSMFGVAKLFYGHDLKKGWFDALKATVERKYGTEDQFTGFMHEVTPFLQYGCHWRNCVEHPKPQEYILAKDFTLTAEMELFPPTIELVHPKAHQPPIAISSFMDQTIEQVSKVFEMMIAFLCSKHVRASSKFPVQVVDLQEADRRDKKVRFGYGVRHGNQILPIT